MKRKVGELFNKPIVIGNKNEVTKNEIHINNLNVPTSGEGGGLASSWRYFDISKLDTRVKPMLLPFIVKNPYYNRIAIVSDNVIWADITAVGVDDSPKLMQDGVIMSWSQMMAVAGLTPEVMAQQGIVEITEEEFYNFDVPEVSPV